MLSRFNDQVVIVTGGSRGIGFAAAMEFAREGAMVVIASKDPKRGNEAQEEILRSSGKSVFIKTDVTQEDEVKNLVSSTIEQFGTIHVLVNNAGIHEKAPFEEESSELWDRLYQTNVIGTVLPSQKVVAVMKANKQGAIVNVASKAGVVGEPGHAAYSASKGAVIALTRAMAIELAAYNIRVNTICPGPVNTDMLLESVPTEEGRKELAENTPLKRVGTAEDIARGILFLASSDADWCTGQAISVDGGLSILK